MKKCVFVLLAALAVVSCSKDSGSGSGDDSSNTRAYINMTGNFEELSVVNAELAFSVFGALNEYVGENETPVLLSPVSLSFALGMLNNGAANETRDAFISVLGGGCADIDEMNDYYQTLASQLTTLDKTTKLKIANSQWSSNSFELLPDYSDAVSNYFNADLYMLNPSTAVSDINNWCSDKTEGLINNFYSDGEITETTKTILLNALYFNGVWSSKFNKNDTHNDTFTSYDGKTAQTQYMNKTAYASCYEAEKYSALTLFFGNKAFCMQIVLPKTDVSLSDCIASLNADEWLDWYDKGYFMDYDVLLPKFSVEYKGYLEDVLAQLGMVDAIYSGDYSNMSSDDEFSGLNLKVKQATKFSIDEEGVEAAAVTSGELLATDPGDPSETGEFHVTRPFLYLIKENSSNTILFIGRITRL